MIPRPSPHSLATTTTTHVGNNNNGGVTDLVARRVSLSRADDAVAVWKFQININLLCLFSSYWYSTCVMLFAMTFWRVAAVFWQKFFSKAKKMILIPASGLVKNHANLNFQIVFYLNSGPTLITRHLMFAIHQLFRKSANFPPFIGTSSVTLKEWKPSNTWNQNPVTFEQNVEKENSIFCFIVVPDDIMPASIQCLFFSPGKISSTYLSYVYIVQYRVTADHLR